MECCVMEWKSSAHICSRNGLKYTAAISSSVTGIQSEKKTPAYGNLFYLNI